MTKAATDDEQREYTQIAVDELERLLAIAKAARIFVVGGFNSKTEWRDARRDLRIAVEALDGE